MVKSCRCVLAVDCVCRRGVDDDGVPLRPLSLASLLHLSCCISPLASLLLHLSSCISPVASLLLHLSSCISPVASLLLHLSCCISPLAPLLLHLSSCTSPLASLLLHLSSCISPLASLLLHLSSYISCIHCHLNPSASRPSISCWALGRGDRTCGGKWRLASRWVACASQTELFTTSSSFYVHHF